MCVSRCGSIAVVENGRFIALEPDPSHPTGKALCAKGRAAPELVYHADRLLYPLKRTRPKGDPDPGWQPISWDEALDLTAARLRRIAGESGPESVVFSVSSPSTSASSDSLIWIQRLMKAFGSPNQCMSMELCGWGRYGATLYTYGAAVPGALHARPRTRGLHPFLGLQSEPRPPRPRGRHHGSARRGARLIVVDPRRVGPANKADMWLRVRPGTDAALALGIADVMIERGWYDRAFIRDWTNGPLLVRSDNGRLLTESDLSAGGSPQRLRRLGRAQRPADSSTTRPRGAMQGRQGWGSGALALRCVRDRRTVGAGRLPARVRPHGAAMPAVSPGAGGGDLWSGSPAGRSGGPAPLGSTARCVLCLERRGDADELHPDRPGYRAVVRTDRVLRLGGG